MAKDSLRRLKEELEKLQIELEQTDFDDEQYDKLVNRIGEIQKILNATEDTQERKRDNIRKVFGGILKITATGMLYLLGMDLVTNAEKERPLISKALNAPKDILKLG